MLVFFSQSVSHFSHTASSRQRGEREREISADFNLERNLVAARAFKKAKAPVGPAIANACMIEENILGLLEFLRYSPRD